MLLRLPNNMIVNTHHIVMVSTQECTEEGRENTDIYIKTTRGQIKINCNDEFANEFMLEIEGK